MSKATAPNQMYKIFDFAGIDWAQLHLLEMFIGLSYQKRDGMSKQATVRGRGKGLCNFAMVSAW